MSTEGGKTAFFGPLTTARGPGHLTYQTGPHIAPCGPLQHYEGGIAIIKQNRSLADQVFGIGRYTYSKDGQLYFVHGNCRIKVTEHFSSTGKPMDSLLEDLIQFSAQRREDNPHRAVQE